MMMVVRHCQNYIQAIATIIAYSLGCTNTVKGLFCQALQHPLPRMTLSRAASSNHRAHERQNLKNEFKMTAQFITNKMCPFGELVSAKV